MKEQLYSIFAPSYDGGVRFALNLTVLALIDYIYKYWYEDCEDDALTSMKNWEDIQILEFLQQFDTDLADSIIVCNGEALKEECPITEEEILVWFKAELERGIKRRKE